MADKDFSAIAIGKRITECRKMLGLTQEELAEKGDMTTQFVSYAESGKRVIRSENLLKLSKALEVSADFLLTGEIVDKDMFIMLTKICLSCPKSCQSYLPSNSSLSNLSLTSAMNCFEKRI